MSSYNVEPCNFKYRVSALEKVVDGDTIDVCIDLGFDVLTRQRVRLLGIDTPESRTSDAEEKKFGLLSKKKLKEWCLKAVASEKDDIEIELRCPEGIRGVSLDVFSQRFGFMMVSGST
jgi:micrococcal nuclease